MAGLFVRLRRQEVHVHMLQTVNIIHEWIYYGSTNCVIYNSYKIAVFTYHSPHFCFPWGRPWGNHAIVVWMESEFDAYKLSRSMYPSIFNSFPVIRTASAKNLRFHVLQTTFEVPLETPLRLSRNMFHGWKDNSMLSKRLAASTYLSSIVSELYDAQVNA